MDDLAFVVGPLDECGQPFGGREVVFAKSLTCQPVGASGRETTAVVGLVARVAAQPNLRLLAGGAEIGRAEPAEGIQLWRSGGREQFDAFAQERGGVAGTALGERHGVRAVRPGALRPVMVREHGGEGAARVVGQAGEFGP